MGQGGSQHWQGELESCGGDAATVQGVTQAISPPELGEGDVQVPVAELRQGPALHRRHQAARQDPAPWVR